MIKIGVRAAEVRRLLWSEVENSGRVVVKKISVIFESTAVNGVDSHENVPSQ